MNQNYRKFKPQPSISEISYLWNELLARETLAPKGRRMGIALARTRLFDGFPAWRLPDVLDALNEGRALA